MTIHGVGQLDPVTQQVATLLENLGVVFPGPVDPSIDKVFPADLTAVSLLELGEHHSYWSAQYARLTTVHGVVTAQKRSLKHQIQELKRLPQPVRPSRSSASCGSSGTSWRGWTPPTRSSVGPATPTSATWRPARAR